jgi:hypothetical protein
MGVYRRGIEHATEIDPFFSAVDPTSEPAASQLAAHKRTILLRVK